MILNIAHYGAASTDEMGLPRQQRNFTDGVVICKKALEAFTATLPEIAADAANLFFLIDTQGALEQADWANELHPYPAGFKRLAACL